MKKIALILALVLSLSSLCLLASCDDGQTTAPAPSEQQSPSEKPASDSEKPSSDSEKLSSDALPLSPLQKDEGSISESLVPSLSPSTEPSSFEEPSVSPEPSLDTDPALVGTWKTDMDMTELYVSMFTLMMEPEMTEYFDFEDFSFLMTITLEMDEEGCYTVTFDEETMKESATNLIAIVTAGMKDYMTDSFTAEAEELGTTLKDYLEYVMEEEIDDVDAYLDAMTAEALDGLSAEELVGVEPEYGLYGVKDGRLYFYLEDDIVFEGDYMLYSFEEGVLKLDLPEDKKAEEEAMSTALPMIFTRGE